MFVSTHWHQLTLGKHRMAALLKFVMATACAVAWGAVPLAACAQEALDVVQIVPLSGPLAQAGREINAMTRATLDD